MDRSRELVEDAKKVLALVSPSLAVVRGDWYLFEKEGEDPFIEWVDDEGNLGGDSSNASREAMESLYKWSATPVLVYKVIADR